ncbi:MAG: ImmA/IrrE family metallo-endopeptidase [Acetobacter sp.]|nr:ImmA/IrrE family metallo-endopeptidase [Acetobacter sp.]
MDNSSETRDLKNYLDQLDHDDKTRAYDATIVSVLMLQRRGKADGIIEKRLGIKLRPEHRKAATLGDAAHLKFDLTWDAIPRIGNPNDDLKTGHARISIKNKDINDQNSLWEFDSIQLLQWLSASWASLVLSEPLEYQRHYSNVELPQKEVIPDHNFVEAFNRTNISRFSFFKVGNLMQVSMISEEYSEDDSEINNSEIFTLPFSNTKEVLSQVGDLVASRLMWLSKIGAINIEVHNLVNSWRGKNILPISRVVELSTKRMPDDKIGEWLIQHVVSDVANSNTSVDLSTINTRSKRLLAAARMMGSLAPDQMLEVLAALDSVTFAPLERQLLDVSTRALAAYEKYSSDMAQYKRPVQLGYYLANWLRADAKLNDQTPGDPGDLLEKWNVRIHDVHWATNKIDAIACWQKHSQPTVFLNRNGIHSQSLGGRRASLAHEICHILVDRNLYFPVVEVLGGILPKTVEQIARGFQAEFLLPRNTARNIVGRFANISEAIDEITNSFGVSQQLAANQILNANCPLTIEDRNLLNDLAMRLRSQ